MDLVLQQHARERRVLLTSGSHTPTDMNWKKSSYRRTDITSSHDDIRRIITICRKFLSISRRKEDVDFFVTIFLSSVRRGGVDGRRRRCIVFLLETAIRIISLDFTSPFHLPSCFLNHIIIHQDRCSVCSVTGH